MKRMNNAARLKQNNNKNRATTTKPNIQIDQNRIDECSVHINSVAIAAMYGLCR